jgi:hypothetical protein
MIWTFFGNEVHRSYWSGAYITFKWIALRKEQRHLVWREPKGDEECELWPTLGLRNQKVRKMASSVLRTHKMKDMAATVATKPGGRWQCRQWSYESRNWGRYLPLRPKSQEVREMIITGARNPEIEGDGCHYRYNSKMWGRWLRLAQGTQKLGKMAATGARYPENERDGRNWGYESKK